MTHPHDTTPPAKMPAEEQARLRATIPAPHAPNGRPAPSIVLAEYAELIGDAMGPAFPTARLLLLQIAADVQAIEGRYDDLLTDARAVADPMSFLAEFDAERGVSVMKAEAVPATRLAKLRDTIDRQTGGVP